MSKNAPLSIIIITLVAILAGWYLYPSVVYYSKTPAQRRELRETNPELLKKVVNLGLDLQGGMRLVLEIDRTKLDKDAARDALDRAYTIIENRINGLGVAEPTIQIQRPDRIVVELPGLEDEKAAKRVIGSTAQLEFRLLREPTELDRAIKVIESVLKGEDTGDSTGADTLSAGADSTEETVEAQETAKRLFEGTDLAVEDTAAGDTTSDTTKPAKKDDGGAVTSLVEMLVPMSTQHIGVLEKNKNKVNRILRREDVRAALSRAGLGGSMFLWDHDLHKQDNKEFRGLYYVKNRAEIRGDIIKDARASIAQGGMEAGNWIVNMEMNRKGAQRFSRVTGANVGKYLAIILDSTVYSAPVIRQKIPHGSAQISGTFAAEESRGLAIVLRAGALPAPVQIIEERTVGPSLGQDSIKRSVNACLIGFILVILFMAWYYGLSGIIADFAVMLNLIFVIAIMASIGATLTLPGIAGLILIIGMSVDANVIIFERIREELGVGKTVRSAIDAGYSRAFITILDSNLTTLITAAILYFVGTGPIRGFAVTLSLGIIVSMFTALFITRVIFNLVTAGRNIKKLSIG